MSPSRRDYDPPRIYRPGASSRASGPRPPDGPRYPGPYPPAAPDRYDSRYDSPPDASYGYAEYRSRNAYREERYRDDDRYSQDDYDEPDGFARFDSLPALRSRGFGSRRFSLPLTNRAVLAGFLVLVLLGIVAYASRGHSTLTGQAQPNPAAAGTRSAAPAPSKAKASGATAASASASDAAGAGAGTDAAAGASPAPSGSANADPNKYEAEDALQNTLGPTTKLRNVAGASGGIVVTSVGHGTPAGDVRFDAVNADAAGQYTLTISYLLADTVAHRLALWVNGKGPTILSFKPLGGDTIGTYKATVTLAAGANVIRFSNATTAYGPDLDCITVAPVG